MTAKSVECVGFAHPDRRGRTRRRRDAMVVHLIMSAALTLSILVAVSAVSIGMNRADVQTRDQIVWKSLSDQISAAELRKWGASGSVKNPSAGHSVARNRSRVYPRSAPIDAQVGYSRPAWCEPGIQTHGSWVYLDSGFAAARRPGMTGRDFPHPASRS